MPKRGWREYPRFVRHFECCPHDFLSSDLTNVSASWVVPSANCVGAPKNEYYPQAAMWVGIEDFRNIEPIGMLPATFEIMPRALRFV